MRTIEISNNSLNKLIDAIHGACVALGYVYDKQFYSKDEYTQAINKLGSRINDFFKVCKIDHDNTMKSYLIGEIQIEAMRRTKSKGSDDKESKVLSGSGFRRKFKGEWMAKFHVEFKTISDKASKTKGPSKKELEAKIKELEAKLAAK